MAQDDDDDEDVADDTSSGEGGADAAENNRERNLHDVVGRTHAVVNRIHRHLHLAIGLRRGNFLVKTTQLNAFNSYLI